MTKWTPPEPEQGCYEDSKGEPAILLPSWHSRNSICPSPTHPSHLGHSPNKTHAGKRWLVSEMLLQPGFQLEAGRERWVTPPPQLRDVAATMKNTAHGKGEYGFSDAMAGRRKEKNPDTKITMRKKEDYAKIETNLNKSERNCQCLGTLRRRHNSLTHVFGFLGLLFSLLGFLIPLLTFCIKLNAKF